MPFVSLSSSPYRTLLKYNGAEIKGAIYGHIWSADSFCNLYVCYCIGEGFDSCLQCAGGQKWVQRNLDLL